MKIKEKINNMTIMQKIVLIVCSFLIFSSLLVLCVGITFQKVEYMNKYTGEIYCVKEYFLGNLVNDTCNESKEVENNWKNEFLKNSNFSGLILNQS